MSDIANEPVKIKIREVKGGTVAEQDDLKGCYFVQLSDPNLYQFYAPQGTPIPTVPAFVSNGDFHFIRAGKLWHAYGVIFGDITFGFWHLGELDPKDHGNAEGNSDDDNTFQAMSGGSGMEQTAYATA
jgi:hypothetical protein